MSCPARALSSVAVASRMHPFVEGLRGLVRSVERARLPAILGPDRLQLARLLPELAERSEDVSDDPEFDRNGQARLFELVLGVIERLSRTAPVVLVIEDLQWADEATRDLLAFLVRNLRASPTVALVSVRTDELGRHPAVLGFLARARTRRRCRTSGARSLRSSGDG